MDETSRSQNSLPPYEDSAAREGPGEARDQPSAHRKQQRRKKRNAITGAALVLAAIALFCLWYTRPRKLAALLGGWSPDNMAAAMMDLAPIVSEDGEVKSNIDIWLLNGVAAGDPAMEDIWSALENATCRARLRSLVPVLQDGFESYDGISGQVSFIFVLDKDESSSFNLMDNGEITLRSDGQPAYLRADGELYTALSRLVMEYGELKKD